MLRGIYTSRVTVVSAPDGCGKSTLMKIIAGIETADGGTMTMQKGLKLGYLAQQGQVGEGRTVLEELESVFEPVQRMEQQLRDLEHQMADAHDEASLHRLGSQYDQLTRRFEESNGYGWRSTVQGVLAGLGFRKEQQGQMASLLSGGERTRLCLGRMLLTEPDVLLLDEPTNHLDLKSIAWLEDYLRTYRGAVLLISHDRYFMDHVCDRMCELLLGATECYDGNYSAYMVQRTERFEIRMKAYELQQKEIARQEAIIARYRQFNREKSIRLAESREKRLEKVERLEKPTDESAIHFHFDVRRRTGDDVLMIDDLAKGFSGRTLFEHVKMHLRAGDRVALIGDNGVGKSTILKSIIRQLSLIAGTVSIDGKELSSYAPKELAKKMAIVMTERIHPERYTCYDVVATGRYPYTGKMGMLQKEDEEKIEEAMRQVQVEALRDQDFERISDGQRQRVMLARAICQEPEILVLDEPTSYLDIRYKTDFLWLLRSLARKRQMAVVMSLHEIDLAQKISDQVVCVKEHRVDRVGTPEEVMTTEYIQELYAMQDGVYDAAYGSVEFPKPTGDVHTFVIGGGGYGIPLYRKLQRQGIPCAAGILPVHDREYPVAKALCEKVLEIPAFTMPEDTMLAQAKALIDACETVYCPCMEFGVCNSYNQELYFYAKKQNKLKNLSE